MNSLKTPNPMKSYLYLILLGFGLACSTDNPDPADQLAGTWRLITYCKPATSSTCTTVTIPSGKGVFITFDRSGAFTEFYENTIPVEYGFLGCGPGRYAVEGNDVRIIAGCMSSSNGRLMPFTFLASNRIVIRPFSTGDYVFVRQ